MARRLSPIRLWCMVFCLLIVPAAHAADADKQQKLISDLESYYAKLYSKPLNQKARLPKLVGLMSLARLDSQPTTSALIEAAGNKDPVVAYLAWEILHARRASLVAANYEYWVKRGLELAVAGNLPGKTITPALEAAASINHDAARSLSGKLFDHLTTHYSPMREDDLPVLKAGGALLAAWNHPPLLQRVAGQMSDKTRGAAAEYLLMALPGAPAADTPAQQKRTALMRLARSARPTTAPTIRPYTGVGKAVPPPAKLTDPDDPQWRKELELGKLAISSFELAWVIDATGSMNQVNQVVAANTARVSRVLEVVSGQTRIGAVYYRHEIDPRVQVACCSKATTPPAYQTKPHALNRDADALAAAMAKEDIPKPDRKLRNTHPGCAVHGGLMTAIAKLDWTQDPTSRRVIVLIGDSTLTEGSEKATAALAAEAAKNGYQIHALTLSKGTYDNWHPVLEAAHGLHFDFTTVMRAARTGKARQPRPDMTSITDFDEIAKLLIKASISKDYHDRADPLLQALSPYIEAITSQANP